MGDNQLCYGCMEQKGTSITCPHCGYQENAPYSPDYIAPGTMLHERYIIGRMLGHNGEGATYLAYDTAISYKVLIREYMPVGLCTRVKGKPTISVNYNNLAQYKALMAEYTELNKTLAKMRSLNHINPTLDLFAENNTTYTVYEYIEGVKLMDYLKDNAGELSWSQVKKMFPPLFTTLSLIHNAGIIHRGLSPETIYVTEKGELRISGFCISSVRTLNTEMESEIYPGYAAPEQSSASARQGTWTDVYGICAVLYRILTGCMPTEAMSRVDNDNLCSPHELSGTVPERVSSVIMDGLLLDGSERIQTITELVTRLFEATEEETSQLRIVEPMQRPLQRAPRPAAPKPQPPVRRPQPPVREPVREVYEDPYDDYDVDAGGQSAIDKIKIPAIIGVLLIAVIAIVFIIIFQLIGGDDSQKIAKGDVSSSSVADNVVPVDSDAMEPTTEAQFDSEMPDIVNKYFDAKQADLGDWIILDKEEVYDETYPAGVICWQEIAPGTKFNSGTTMKVKVSLGSAKRTLPSCKGYKLSAYKSVLDEMGIKYTATPTKNLNYASGYVIETSIEGGTEIDLTTDYKLVITYADNPVVTTEPAETTAAAPATNAPTNPTTTVAAPTTTATPPSGGDAGQGQ